MSLSTPRILPKHISQFGPSNPIPGNVTGVRLLGTITTIHGSTATLTSGDGETVTLVLNRDSHLSPQGTYEILGKVINLEGGQGLGLKVLSATEWPKNEKGQAIDFKLWEAVVEVTHKYKEIFYIDEEK